MIITQKFCLNFHNQWEKFLTKKVNFNLIEEPFQDQLKAEPEVVTKQYGEEFYEGPVDTVK